MQKYLCDDAEYVAVALGSMATQIADVVDRLREEGPKAGLRAFPSTGRFRASCWLPSCVVAKA